MSSALTGSVGDKNAFTISESAVATIPKVVSVSVSGTDVILTLDNPIVSGTTVQVSYGPTGTSNLTNTTTTVQGFTAQSVENTQ